MSTTQPQENPNILDAKVKELEAFNNKITVAGAEVNRLNGLIQSSGYTITEQHKEKVYLTEIINNLKIEKKKVSDEIKAINIDIVNDKKALEEIQKTDSEITRRQNESTGKIDERESNVLAREIKVDSRKKEAKVWELSLSSRETGIQEKKSKLTKVLEEI